MDAAKYAVQQYWDTRPCGSSESTDAQGSPEFFQRHARVRYEREPEIQDFACFNTWAGRQVLEIGVGMGADYIRFIQAGARAVGVDLSLRSLELARQNAENNQVKPLLLHGDAEALPFPNGSFDLVYSWGVLHHTPEIERALREVHRVLRPGGECRAMFYNRTSLVALQCYLRYGLGRLQPFAGLRSLIESHVESPGTKAFTIAELRALFQRFCNVEIEPTVTAYDLRVGRRWFAPRWLLGLVPKGLGWFVLVRGQK